MEENKKISATIKGDAEEFKRVLDKLPDATKAQLLCVAKGMELAIDTAAKCAS